MRVLVDTNVIISIAMFGSFPGLYEALGRDEFTALFPSYCIDEAYRVVALKWPGRIGVLDRFFTGAAFEEVTEDDADAVAGIDADGIGLSIRDAADLPVLRAALAARADVIVTGDKDFAGASTGGVPVCTPAQFIAEHL